MPNWLAWLVAAPYLLYAALFVGGVIIVVPIILRDEWRHRRRGPEEPRGKNAREAEERERRRSR